MVVVPDGRVDYDKLLELLAETEENHLDFEAAVDIDSRADQLKLIKDMITMSSRPPGGYILIGVDDGGTPCMPAGTITDRRRYDGAKLGDLIRPYIEGQTTPALRSTIMGTTRLLCYGLQIPVYQCLSANRASMNMPTPRR